MSSPRITAAVSATDGRVCTFTVDHPLTDAPRLCRSSEGARGSPLFEELFALPAVAQVWVTGGRVTVARSEDTDWKDWAPRVGAALRKVLSEGRPLFAPVNASVSQDLTEQVQDLLMREINPGLAQHGGRVELVDLKNGVARVRFAGGCQGCGAAQLTLSQGVRRAVLDRFPTLSDVVDATDHAAGENPYYADKTGPSPFPK